MLKTPTLSNLPSIQLFVSTPHPVTHNNSNRPIDDQQNLAVSMLISDPKQEQQLRIKKFVSKARAGRSSKSVYPARLSLEGMRDSTNQPQISNNSTHLFLKNELENIEQERARQRTKEKFVMEFSQNQELAIRGLIQRGIVGSDGEIASYIYNAEAISKVALGQYFGKNNAGNLEVLKHYCKCLGLKGMEFDTALRLLLSRFRLPGESQQIERILLIFSEAYFDEQTNPTITSQDLHILSYSLIMLNTDTHNPNLKSHMTLPQFIKNTMRACPSLPIAYLESMFHRVVSYKFETETSQVESVYMRLHLLKNMKSLKDVRVELAELRKGHLFTKYCKSRCKAVKRRVFIDATESEIRWEDPEDEGTNCYRSIKLASVVDLVLGGLSEVMRKNKVNHEVDSLCFSIVATSRTLDLHATNPEHRAKWINYIGGVLVARRQALQNAKEQEYKASGWTDQTAISEIWHKEILPHWDKYWDYKGHKPKKLAISSSVFESLRKSIGCYSSNKEKEDSPQQILVAGVSIHKNNLLTFLWKEGLPNKIRKALWPIVIGNSLSITQTLYQISMKKKPDVSQLHKHPFRQQSIVLVELLQIIRPDILPLRNLLELSQVLSTHLTPYNAFCCFANLLHQHHFLGFFNGQAVQSRINLFDHLMKVNLPLVSEHFQALSVNTRLYLVGWFVSMFGNCFSSSFLARIWDNFLLEGELYLFKVGITILKYYEFELKISTFDGITRLLTSQFNNTSAALFFDLLETTIKVTTEDYYEYIQKPMDAVINARVHEIPLR